MENEYASKKDANSALVKTNDTASPLKREALRDLVNLNTSGDPSQNNKANDKTQNLSNSQTSSSSKNNNKILDESSDSSLDYDSANEGSSPRDDSASDALSDKLKTPKTERKHIYTASLESAKTPQNSPFKEVLYNLPNDNLSEEVQNRLINHKKKVYNELTESFETPNSSFVSPVNTSIAIPVNDTYEIGEDPLSFTDELSFKLSYEPDFQQENVQNDIDELSKSCDTVNADDNETRSYCSNDRESSVEVLKEGPRVDLDETYPVGSNDLGENINLDTTSVNNSFISAFTKLSVSPRCVEDVIKAENHVDNQEFDEKLNVSKSRRGSGASILVITSSDNEVPNEILQQVNSNDKCEIENSTDNSLVLDQKLTNINPTIPETNVVEINASGCEEVVETILQDDIKLVINPENPSSTLVSEDNSNVESVTEEVQTAEKINDISNTSQSKEDVECVQQLDVLPDKELTEFTDLEFNDNEINSEKDVCETKNLQVIVHQNEPIDDPSFCEPMDCDDSYIVKNISEIIEAVNPYSPVLNSFQESEPMIAENSDLSKSYTLDVPIENTLDINVQEVQSPDLKSTESNITKEEIFTPNTNKEQVLELNVNKESVSELTNISKVNTTIECTDDNKLQILNTFDGSALVEDAGKEENNKSLTNNSDESLPVEVIKEEILAKENVSVVEATIDNENIQNQQSGNNTLSESVIEKLSKSLSSDSLEAFNLEEKNCEISNVSDSSSDNTIACISENVEKSNSPTPPLKVESVEIENINKCQEEIEKPKFTNIEDIPIKCKPINYNEIDFDLENPFATSSKVRNSVERENTNNSIIEKSKNLDVENQSTGKKSNTVSMDTSYIVEKSNVVDTKKPSIDEMSKTIVVEKPLAKEKSTSINMDNPFATITKVRNSTDRSVTLKSDIDNENMNDTITEVESHNGNAEAKTVKITPNTISKDININNTIELDSNLDSEKPVFDNRKDEAFKSPVAPIQNKRVDQISKTAPKGNLSPMSRCGDLMGLSPVANTDSKNTTKCARTSDVANDFLTGKDLLPDCNNMDDMMDVDDDDDFKMPMFQDPVDFDFLQNCGNNGLAGRDFGKESLFVKFDPLVSRLPTGARINRDSGAHLKPSENQFNPRKVDDDASTASGLAESCSSDSSVSAINSEQGKTLGTMSSVEQSLGVLSLQTQSSQPLIASVPAIPQAVNPNVSSLQAGDKPTQIVSPAKSLRPQYQPCTPPSSHSLSKNNLPVSPAIAAIDRLINLGLNTPPPPPPVIQPKQEPEMNPQLLNELQSVRELLGNQEQDLQQANDQISSLKQQLSESSEREQTLIDRVNEKSKDNRQMSIVMEEYERTMSQIIGERDAEKRQWFDERTALVRDRDETSSHLASIEHSFNDIHAKYERCKTVIQTYKTNEDLLKQTVARYEENLKKQVERYEQLRQHAMSQLDKASQEIDAVKKSSQAEIIKLQAMLKKSDIQISSLQESLAQKTKNCEELTQICDELINKVG